MNTLECQSNRSLLRRLGAQRLRLLPPLAEFPPLSDEAECRAIIAEIQRFRGAVYLADDAIPATALDEDGRHLSHADHLSWHIYTDDAKGSITGCIRVLKHNPGSTSGDLMIARYLNAMRPGQARSHRSGVDRFLKGSLDRGVPICETGGWAVCENRRGSFSSIILPCACWALAHLLGNSLGIALATSRNRAADILLRLGGFPLPPGSSTPRPFFDGYHRCHVQFLGFESWRPAAPYRQIVDNISAHFLGLECWRWPDGRQPDQGAVVG